MAAERPRSRAVGRVLTAIAVGLIVTLVSAALLLSPAGFVQVVQLSFADFLFVSEDGPQFGVRPARSDIVLVAWDQRSRDQMGITEPALEQDLQLYQVLKRGGARVIGDTRLLFYDSPDLREFMERLVEIDAEGKVLRDVNPGSPEWFLQRRDTYVRHIAHSPLLDPSLTDVTQLLRYYPLLTFDAIEGFNETMGVKVARALLRAPAQPRTAIPEPDERGVVKWRRALLEVASSPGLEQVWQESGIAAIWSTTSALATTETMPQPIAEAGRRPRPYRLSSDHEIRWLTPPKEPLPYLVSPAAVWINYTGTGPVPGLGDAVGVSERCAAWPERLWRRFPDVLLGLVVCSRHTRISYVDALQAPPSSFDGKAILVGYDLVPGDPFPTPLSLSNRLDRSEVVAQAVQTIADGRYIEETPAAVNVALAGLLGLSGALLVAFLRPLRGSIAGIVLLMLCLAAMTSLFRSVALLMSWVAPSALLSSGVLVGGYQYVREERDRRRIADLFGRYVPRAVVDNVLERSEAQSRALGGVTRDVTVLFADIRGFTAFSEHLPPQEVLTRLNQLLQIMVTCAFKYQGTVDKYIGDAIMVLYNAPLDQADHAERAVRTAMDMQRELATQGGDLGFGIGIHCGEAVVGTVGTPERMEYTAIGATVNLASRLCDTAKQGEVIVSEEVRACLGNRIVAEERAPIRVKNIDRDLQTYVVVQLTDTIDPARPAP